MSWSKHEMAQEVLKLIPDFSSINLGIGMPTLVSEVLPEKHNYMIHSENGVLGVSGRPSTSNVSPTLINAGKETISINNHASFFDSSMSFGMIRGGHLDFAVLGGMQVDVEGSLANWKIPGKKMTGMGGAMDLVNGAKNVIVMMTQHNKDGISKLVKKCDLPLTGKSVVHFVVTELAVYKIENKKFNIIIKNKSFNLQDEIFGL